MSELPQAPTFRGMKLGGNVAIGVKHEQQVPGTAGDDFKQRLQLEKTGIRVLQLNASYQAAAAQPTYGFMAFDAPVTGKLWEVLQISMSYGDPFTTTQGTQAAQTGSSANYGSVVAPAANASLVSTGNLSAGFYQLYAGAWYGATADVADNVKLVYSGIGTILAGLPVNPVVNGTPQFVGPITWQVDGAHSIQLQAIAAGAAGSVYKGIIIATLLPGATPVTGQVQALGYVATMVPQDSNVEPAFPNLKLLPQTLPFVSNSPRRNIILQSPEKLILAMKGVPNNQQVTASIMVMEFERSDWFANTAP